MELTKGEKKAAREIIEKGLRKEMEGALLQLQQLIEKGRQSGLDVKENYCEVYESITQFDRHLAQLYDGMRGSNYALIILVQLRAGVVTKEDLAPLRPDTQQWLLDRITIEGF